MRYMIVRWNVDKLEWEVLHYSHSLVDAERMFKTIVLKYPDCHMMLDYKQVHLQKFATELKDIMEKFNKLVKEKTDV